MNREDLRAFARRDWSLIGRGRLRYWAERYASDGGRAARDAATMLYEHARRLGPWPTESDRARDLADHLRLREKLDRAASAFTGR